MLEFDAASKHFDTVAALDGCTFTAVPGRLTGFLGPNGALGARFRPLRGLEAHG